MSDAPKDTASDLVDAPHENHVFAISRQIVAMLQRYADEHPDMEPADAVYALAKLVAFSVRAGAPREIETLRKVFDHIVDQAVQDAEDLRGA